MSLFSSNKNKKINPAKRLSGSVVVPGDKSISHRYAMLAAIAEGASEIKYFSSSADCQSTLACLKKLGVKIDRKDDTAHIRGGGLGGLRAASGALDAGNSGSTMRMLTGILAGQSFPSVIGGDASLSRRPMKRVIDPLTQMGAGIKSNDGGRPPLEIAGSAGHALRPIRYQLPVPSAQVKSTILLAGLYAEGNTEVVEPALTRDHTEIALEQMGAEIGRHGQTISIRGRTRLEGRKLFVPGDISSAVFFMVAGLLVPEANLVLPNVGLNPTRTAILDLLAPMGGRVKVLNVEMVNGELLGDLHVETSKLEGGEIPVESIPGLIDELPALCILGTQTERGIIFHGARELRVKESDRIGAMAENLRLMGAAVEEFDDGLRVEGRQTLRGAVIDSHGDHRIAMAFAVAGLLAQGTTVIRGSDCVDISFPNFFDVLARVAA
ncbi:MAG TPA: 3-phosphoshikimate 1-carboxyvinyltransferase [Terriglobia bacterium]|nr:3-phosphoshikimate 1-carboxyvinyltransferase [Terriglobia bacterium]